MKHKKFKELLQLSLVDELSTEETNLLRDHLLGCPDCSAELKELKQLMSFLGESGAGEPSEQLLWEARQGLREAIRRETLTESILTRLTQGVAPPDPSSLRGHSSTRSPGLLRGGWMGWFSGFRLALSGTAAVAVGILIGYLTFGRGGVAEPLIAPSMEVAGDMGGPDISNIRFVSWDQRDGQIEVEYDLVRPVRLRSTVDDERVKRVLARALVTGDNPGVRLKAIDALDSPAARVHGPDVRQALIDAVETDPNVGVRNEALRVLAEMTFDDQIKKTCLYVLENDNNPGMRVAAINLLSGARLAGYPVGQDVYDFLVQQLREEDDPVLRARGSVFIEEVKDE
jgi:hypothetical protein